MAELFATTGNSVARIIQQGNTWNAKLTLKDSGAQCLALDPHQLGTLYVGTHGKGVWKSSDKGQTWQRVDAGRDRHYTWGLAVDPDDPDCWFISACPGPREAHNPRGNAQAYIYRWRGNGPWQALNGGLPQPLKSFPYALVSVTGYLFAGLNDGRIYVSHDLGDNWQLLTLMGDTLSSILALAYVE